MRPRRRRRNRQDGAHPQNLSICLHLIRHAVATARLAGVPPTVHVRQVERPNPAQHVSADLLTHASASRSVVEPVLVSLIADAELDELNVMGSPPHGEVEVAFTVHDERGLDGGNSLQRLPLLVQRPVTHKLLYDCAWLRARVIYSHAQAALVVLDRAVTRRVERTHHPFLVERAITPKRLDARTRLGACILYADAEADAV